MDRGPRADRPHVAFAGKAERKDIEMNDADRFSYPDRRGGLGTAGLIERSITLLLVVVLLIGVLAILKPFAAAILFGATLAIAAWPLRQRLIRRGFGSKAAAALLLLLSLVVIVL